MHWILQENMFNEDGFARLCEALARLGVPHSFHKVVPFVGEITPEPAPGPGPVIVMGTISMARRAKERHWWPGSFVNDNFDFLVQRNAWGAENMLNGDSFVCRFGEVTWADFVWANVATSDGTVFVRPTDDSKAFVGQEISWTAFAEWQKKIEELRPEDGATLTRNTWIQISKVRRIAAEFRIWIVNGVAITASQYKFGSIKRCSPDVDDYILRFAEAVCKKWVPADAFVMDVAILDELACYPEQILRIIEVNNINSAGFYDGDMQKLVMALEDYGNREYGRTRS